MKLIITSLVMAALVGCGRDGDIGMNQVDPSTVEIPIKCVKTLSDLLKSQNPISVPCPDFDPFS